MFAKEIQKARRMAKRNRSAVACVRCKAAKSKCSDFRPCKSCVAAKHVCDTGATSANAKEKTITLSSGEYEKRDITGLSFVEPEQEMAGRSVSRLSIECEHRIRPALNASNPQTMSPFISSTMSSLPLFGSLAPESQLNSTLTSSFLQWPWPGTSASITFPLSAPQASYPFSMPAHLGYFGIRAETSFGGSGAVLPPMALHSQLAPPSAYACGGRYGSLSLLP